MNPSSFVSDCLKEFTLASQHTEQLLRIYQAVPDAPHEIVSLEKELQLVGQTIASIQSITNQQWESLDENVESCCIAAIDFLRGSCTTLQKAISPFTSMKDGQLLQKNQGLLGLPIKPILSRFQNCRRTLVLLNTIASL
jgi:hypothetical protein